MTSNAGARNIVENKTIGFVNNEDPEKTYQKNKAEVMNELKKTFRPEFLNRLDEIIVFKKLDKNSVEKISKILLDEFAVKLKSRDIIVEIDESLVKYISEVGFDEVYGARPLKRAIQSKVEDKVAEELLDNKISDGNSIIISQKDGNVIITKK